MKFCSHCGSLLQLRIPEGDSRLRHCCDSCGAIHYLNPKIVAGTIPVFENKILLCKRAIEPRHGYWTLPAGFMENAETTEEAAIRETWEEALAKVRLTGLSTVMNVPHIDQVHIFFRADLIDGSFGVGHETLESRLFVPADIPWDEIAFPTVKETLRYFIDDCDRQSFEVRVRDVRRKP